MGSLPSIGILRKHLRRNTVLAKISPVNTISREKSSKLISLTMSRHSTSEKWGISISGGWMEGQWIGVKQVHSGSPAAFAGLKEGDSLVNVGEELVIFLETGEVEELLNKAGTELNITIERFDPSNLPLL